MTIYTESMDQSLGMYDCAKRIITIYNIIIIISRLYIYIQPQILYWSASTYPGHRLGYAQANNGDTL